MDTKEIMDRIKEIDRLLAKKQKPDRVDELLDERIDLNEHLNRMMVAILARS